MDGPRASRWEVFKRGGLPALMGARPRPVPGWTLFALSFAFGLIACGTLAAGGNAISVLVVAVIGALVVGVLWSLAVVAWDRRRGPDAPDKL